ncbi:hypothetical protein ACFXNW_21525 [Nocardia sp. NPDC059180]|uniref:hypothetical protein n=1 Tax=Nocardia sp. NPDC059180 TaxID=3346761 RepID=UPI00369595D9
MTTSGDSSNQPDAQGDQQRGAGGAPHQPPVAPADPTVLRQPGPPDPQHDPTLLRSFDQPQGGYVPVPPPAAAPGFPYGSAAPGQKFAQPAPGFGSMAPQPHQSAPGFAQPNAPQGQPSIPQNRGFPLQGQGFPLQGQGLPPQDQGFAAGGFGPGGPGGPGFGRPAAAFGPTGPRGQGSSGIAGKGWLWALGGIVVASAMWGGAVLAFGGSSSGGVAPGEPDLRGYSYSGDFCDSADTSPFTESDYTVATTDSSGKDEYPDFTGSEHAAVDRMFCAQRLLPPGAKEDDYQDAHLYSSVRINKKTDPGPEFTADFDTWESSYSDSGGKGEVEEVSGIGDEAYMTIESSQPDDLSPTVSIVVRDGWVVGHFTWSQYVPTSSRSTESVLPQSEVIDKLTESARSTMAALRD